MPSVPGSGSELDIFAGARNWKRYWSEVVARYVRGAVLEVGAGIGSNVPLLIDRSASWLCLEPDSELARRIRNPRCKVICGSLQDLDATSCFDTILYIDVLEHIEDDTAELRSAALHLDPGGALVVLAPAHQWLFSAFDRAIGHFRRYDAASLRACSPPALELERLIYLDTVGLSASLGNRMLLRQSLPSQRQIAIWDRLMIPLSRRIDPVLGHRAGKSLLAVWRKPAL